MLPTHIITNHALCHTTTLDLNFILIKYLLKETLKVDTLCLPEVDLSHGTRCLAISNLLSAVHAEHFIHLVRPLDDDALNGILQLDVTLLTRWGSGLSLLLINVWSSLWERQQCFTLDVPSNLIDTRGQFMNLFLDICKCFDKMPLAKMSNNSYHQKYTVETLPCLLHFWELEPSPPLPMHRNVPENLDECPHKSCDSAILLSHLGEAHIPSWQRKLLCSYSSIYEKNSKKSTKRKNLINVLSITWGDWANRCVSEVVLQCSGRLSKLGADLNYVQS